MKLNVPVGITQVFDDGGNLLSIVAGQVDVEPHMVAGLLAQGFTSAGADALVSDSQTAATVVTESE